MTDERRLVTILFADVTGSTAMGESLDPEDLRALLTRYYEIAKDVVAAHGGTVEKFIGDAVMAVFGLRQAHGDDAVRAIAAALELRDRVRADSRLGDKLPIRLGVNTGDVVASRSDQADDFLITGDAVNVAARLQQAAEPWSILCGARTVRAARAQFRFGPELQIDAKGKSAGVPAREATAHAGATSARTPLFGRDADLAQLELVARRAFDEQRPFMVSVIAPPGTGKTRLLEEFLVRLPRIDDDTVVAVAQCLPYGQRLTYWPLRAVLFRIVGLGEDAPTDEVRRTVHEWLSDAAVEDAPEVASLLASTVGAGEVDAVDRAALFAAWRTFIEAAARKTPLVVVVEDLHWSSDTLLDLFEFVLQPRTETRALMIALARPELLDRRPAWGGGRRNHVSIALEPLDDTSIRHLVQHLAEGAPRGFINAVVERAEGNPFFAGEIVNALIEGVKSFEDPVEVGAALARLPDTVQATVLARLDLLPEDERELIRVGSVFGRTFRPGGVAALIEERVPGASVSDICERLVDRDLIRPSGADGFAFRHILIREVAYATLPRAARATLHGAAGRWLEERSRGQEEALAELVAEHFREAATLATAMELEGAEELRDQARNWLVKASDVARGAAATVEAAHHMRAALEFARPEDLPRFYELLGDVGIGGPAIIEAFRKSLDLMRSAGASADDELRVLAKILSVETRAQGSVGNRPSLAQLNELRSAGGRLLERAADPQSRARFLIAEGFYPFWARVGGVPLSDQDLAAAEESAAQGLAIAERMGDYNLQSAALDAIGSIAQDRAEWDLAIEIGKRRIAMGSRLAMFEQLDAHSVVTWAATIAGKLDVAEQISASGLALVQPRQSPEWALHLAAWRALALMLAGKWDEAERATLRAYAFWLEADRISAGFAMRGFGAALFIAHARNDEARIARWSDVIQTIGVHFDVSRYHHPAIAHWDVQELAEAMMANRQIIGIGQHDYRIVNLSMCTDAGVRLDDDYLTFTLEQAELGRSPLIRATVLRAQGWQAMDPILLDQARSLFESCGALPFVARARCEAAIIRSDKAQFEQGLTYLESIRDTTQVDRYLRADRQSATGEGVI